MFFLFMSVKIYFNINERNRCRELNYFGIILEEREILFFGIVTRHVKDQD